MLQASPAALTEVCEDLLVCGLCSKKIKQPKFLPCHHSFCFNCIYSALKTNQQRISCPSCSIPHTLTFEQMNMMADDVLKTNLILPFMQEKLRIHKAKCDVCDDEETAYSACIDCEMFLCDIHHKAHVKAKETKGHQLINHHPLPATGHGLVVANKHNQHGGPSSGHHALSLALAIPSPSNDSSTTPPPSYSHSSGYKRKHAPSATSPDDNSNNDVSDEERSNLNSRKKGRKSGGVHDQKWDQNFDLLKTLRQQHGNFHFIRDNPALHGWVQYMKAAYKRHKLAPERVEALEQIGFTWSTEKLQIRWDQRIEQLREFKEIHGHCNVPSTAKGDYAGLGQWLASTRMKKRKGHLSDSKTQDLEELGVEWSLKRTAKNSSSLPYYSHAGAGATGSGDGDGDEDDDDSNGSNHNENEIDDDVDDDEDVDGAGPEPPSHSQQQQPQQQPPQQHSLSHYAGTYPTSSSFYPNSNNSSNNGSSSNSSVKLEAHFGGSDSNRVVIKRDIQQQQQQPQQQQQLQQPQQQQQQISLSDSAKMLDFLDSSIGTVVKKENKPQQQQQAQQLPPQQQQQHQQQHQQQQQQQQQLHQNPHSGMSPHQNPYQHQMQQQHQLQHQQQHQHQLQMLQQQQQHELLQRQHQHQQEVLQRQQLQQYMQQQLHQHYQAPPQSPLLHSPSLQHPPSHSPLLHSSLQHQPQQQLPPHSPLVTASHPHPPSPLINSSLQHQPPPQQQQHFSPYLPPKQNIVLS